MLVLLFHLMYMPFETSDHINKRDGVKSIFYHVLILWIRVDGTDKKRERIAGTRRF